MGKKEDLENDESHKKKYELTREEKILLEEYRNAQLSAQHHDTLVWTVTSIFWATNALLIRVVLTTTGDNLKWLAIVLSLVGICLCLSVWKFARQFNDIMGQKYKRCKEIEEGLKVSNQCPNLEKGSIVINQCPNLEKGSTVINQCPNLEKNSKVMRQHSDLPYSSGVQKLIYSIIMVIFIVLWGVIILYKAHSLIHL